MWQTGGASFGDFFGLSVSVVMRLSACPYLFLTNGLLVLCALTQGNQRLNRLRYLPSSVVCEVMKL